MESDYYESKKLASCFLVRNQPNIKIPDRIYEALEPLGKNLVAVIPGDSKKLSFFLTDASRVLFIRLILDKQSLNDKFFISLRTTLKALNMSNLFSTGLCFKEEICVWEGIFSDWEDGRFEEIKQEFSKVTHVKQAKFEKIELEE